MPLRGYGPNTPGALLRLDPKLQVDITSITDDGLQQLFAVQDQLLATAEEAD